MQRVKQNRRTNHDYYRTSHQRYQRASLFAEVKDDPAADKNMDRRKSRVKIPLGIGKNIRMRHKPFLFTTPIKNESKGEIEGPEAPPRLMNPPAISSKPSSELRSLITILNKISPSKEEELSACSRMRERDLSIRGGSFDWNLPPEKRFTDSVNYKILDISKIESATVEESDNNKEVNLGPEESFRISKKLQKDDNDSSGVEFFTEKLSPKNAKESPNKRLLGDQEDDIRLERSFIQDSGPEYQMLKKQKNEPKCIETAQIQQKGDELNLDEATGTSLLPNKPKTAQRCQLDLLSFRPETKPESGLPLGSITNTHAKNMKLALNFKRNVRSEYSSYDKTKAQNRFKWERPNVFMDPAPHKPLTKPPSKDIINLQVRTLNNWSSQLKSKEQNYFKSNYKTMTSWNTLKRFESREGSSRTQLGENQPISYIKESVLEKGRCLMERLAKKSSQLQMMRVKRDDSDGLVSHTDRVFKDEFCEKNLKIRKSGFFEGSGRMGSSGGFGLDLGKGGVLGAEDEEEKEEKLPMWPDDLKNGQKGTNEKNELNFDLKRTSQLDFKVLSMSKFSSHNPRLNPRSKPKITSRYLEMLRMKKMDSKPPSHKIAKKAIKTTKTSSRETKAHLRPKKTSEDTDRTTENFQKFKAKKNSIPLAVGEKKSSFSSVRIERLIKLNKNNSLSKMMKSSSSSKRIKSGLNRKNGRPEVKTIDLLKRNRLSSLNLREKVSSIPKMSFEAVELQMSPLKKKIDLSLKRKLNLIKI